MYKTHFYRCVELKAAVEKFNLDSEQAVSQYYFYGYIRSSVWTVRTARIVTLRLCKITNTAFDRF